MLLSLALIAILMFMLAGNFFSLMGRVTGGISKGHRGRPNLVEVVIEDHDSASKIVLIDIDGVISGSTVDGYSRDLVSTVKDQLRIAADADEVKAVILKVDSPGGEVMASDEISRAIANFQKESEETCYCLLWRTGGFGRLLCQRALPLDCGPRTDADRQYWRDHAHVELSRTPG